MTSCTRTTRRAALVAAAFLTSTVTVSLVHAQNALDEVLKSRQIKIAIPTDFPPYGSVGADMAPAAWTSTSPTTSPTSWG